MKISAKDEYGLRVLLSIARHGGDDGLSISKLSEAEGISEPYVAKITRMLRLSGFIQSTRGKKGGYILSKTPDEIKVAEILHALDGKLFDAEFCGSHAGEETFCNNSIDCSVRSLWRLVQSTIDQVLANVTLADLLEGGPASGINAALRMHTTS
jgi:Rrf2 family protein